MQDVVQRRLLDGNSDHLIVVADGMGGHVRGEFASRLTSDALATHWRARRDEFEPIEATRAANRSVYDAMQENHELLGMGATVVGMHIRQDSLVWFNVGDSRLYLFRTGGLKQLSVDHVPRGATAPVRRNHNITQSIGGAYRPLEVWPAMGTLELRAQDLLLCCTDGLTDCVTDTQIASACAQEISVDELVSQLVVATEAGGAADNFSVVALRR
jgi:serine/threonine protein phosphatase PrpC